MPELSELSALLDAATGPSRELDVSAFQAIFPATRVYEAHCPPLTSSTDAALALVERLLPGWEWSVWRVGETCGATVYNTPEDEIEPSISSHAPTPALAILKSLVAALIAQETTNE